ncbi:MAG: hypothetical protein NDJ89_18920 [Oligoflexia bacterium]|nr:hypothetical protein [Oligoflexia bacterium]
MATACRRYDRATRLEGVPGCSLSCPRLFARPVRVLDISLGGARLDITDCRLSGPPQGEFQAELTFGNFFRYPVMLRFAHVSTKGAERFAGVSFVDPPERLRKLIRGYFGPELLGAGLRAEDTAQGRLRFSGGDGSWLEIGLSEGTVWALRGAFPALGRTVRWERRRAAEPAAPCGHRELARLIRNIPELNPSLRDGLEAVIAEMGSA